METSYGRGLKFRLEESYAGYGNAQERTPKLIVEVDEDELRSMLDRHVRELAKKIADERALELVTIAVKNERELLAKRVREMGHGGRLGMDEKQVELLAAAIEGLAEQSAEMLKDKTDYNPPGIDQASALPLQGIASREAHGSVTVNPGLPPNTTGAAGV